MVGYFYQKRTGYYIHARVHTCLKTKKNPTIYRSAAQFIQKESDLYVTKGIAVTRYNRRTEHANRMTVSSLYILYKYIYLSTTETTIFISVRRKCFSCKFFFCLIIFFLFWIILFCKFWIQINLNCGNIYVYSLRVDLISLCIYLYECLYMDVC